jgi:uncharacterized membrane protein SpoIIM required for sporulation
VISTRWLKERQGHWKRLEQLLDASGGRAGLRSLSPGDLEELGLLYRQAAADLAVLRQDAGGAAFAHALNQLLARAHHTIYSADGKRPAAALRDFVRQYPAVVRRNARYCAIALLVFLAGAVVGTVLSVHDPEFKTQVLGPQMVETINRQEMWTHSIVAIKPIASSQIMTNNITVTLMAFAMGITAGLGTLYMMALNGLMIGVVGTACWMAGMSTQLWSFVAPHGSIEIPSIILAGGAGLRLGSGLLFPGVLPRRTSLSIAGLDAVQLALGCVPLLIVAGLIEAFVSPTDLAVPLKFATGAALFALFTVYILGSRSNRAA